ncbi:hypothetical protein C8Q80DRAFT_1142002 [Daedaleopsis nitida]|nr:hypothetical protein C8Q80DRAFT_1142002 [Daedaleopsis nitida]
MSTVVCETELASPPCPKQAGRYHHYRPSSTGEPSGPKFPTLWHPPQRRYAPRIRSPLLPLAPTPCRTQYGTRPDRRPPAIVQSYRSRPT